MKVEAFSDYDYMNRLNYDIWFTSVRAVTKVIDISVQETPCNFTLLHIMTVIDLYYELRGEMFKTTLRDRV